MRKKTIYVLATVMCMSIFTACGSTNRADAGNEVQQEVQAEDNMQKEQQAGAEGNAETELQTEAVPEEGHRSRRLRHWEQSTMQEKRWHGFFMPKMRVRLCLPQILQRR